MKFRHLVRFTRSRYFTVDYDVYRMSTCIHFSHFSFTTELDSSFVLNFAFPCVLRGFHVYEELWNPRLNEKLDTIHEENNPHDRYAVAAIRKTVSRLTPVIVGHLPREFSRFTRFIILHGATVKVKVSDTKYRRSPLIQGGLEIPVEVEVQKENSSENQQALSKYKTLIAENYHEPVNGKYVDATPDILKVLYSEDELTDFEDEGVDTNTADLDSVVLETGSEDVPLGSNDIITID